MHYNRRDQPCECGFGERLLQRSQKFVATRRDLSYRLSNWEGIPFDEITGQEPNERDIPPERTPEGHLVFYHGTSPEGAQQIITEQRLRPDDFNSVGLSTTPGQAQSFSAMKHGPVLRVIIHPDELSQHLVRREIGGSGCNQFLVGNRERFGSWPGVNLMSVQPHDFERTSMAADPYWLDNWMERHGPYVYHDTANPHGVLDKGLLPWDQSGIGSKYHDALQPRPGHVYLRSPIDISDKAAQDRVRIDLRKLDPRNLNPDEDQLAEQPSMDRWNLSEGPFWADKPFQGTWGEWADKNNLNQPSQTAWSLEGGSMAHHGPIPPEAIDYPYSQQHVAGLPQYAEMVPVDAIKHLREFDRRPGGDPSIAADPQYWNELKENIAQHGFTDPVTLEYNPWSGKGFLGEGNHRLAIAEELGKDIPLMVYRTTREDERMKPMHKPDTYAMYDQRGFSKFPQYAKPSEIGLPVTGPYVPPPDEIADTWYDRQRAQRDQRLQQQPPPQPIEQPPQSDDPQTQEIMNLLYGKHWGRTALKIPLIQKLYEQAPEMWNSELATKAVNEHIKELLEEEQAQSTVPSEVNNPEDHIPEFGGTPPDKNRGVQVSNDWVYTN